MPRGRKKKVEQEIVQEIVEVPKKVVPVHAGTMESIIKSMHNQGIAGLDGVEDAILDVWPDAISNNSATHPVKVGDQLLSIRDIVKGLEGRHDTAAQTIWTKYSRHNMIRTGITIFYLMVINEKEQE